MSWEPPERHATHRLAFALEESDYVALNRAAVGQLWRMPMFGLGLAGAAVLTLGTGIAALTGPTALAQLVGLFAAFLLASGSMPVWMWVFAGRTVRRDMRDHAVRYTFAPQVLWIGPDGFASESAHGRAVKTWAEVHGVLVRPRHIFVWTHANESYILPLRVQPQHDALVATVLAGWDRAHG